MTHRNRLASHCALGALAASIAFQASAQTATPVMQEEPPKATAPGAAANADGTAPASAADIVVTGSRIRGVAPVGSNVIAIDAAKIAQEPVISTNDLLRRVPQVVSLGANRAGGSAQNGAANATRGAGINLRGLSTNATLLLYDGRRFPPQGTQGQFTDPSVIPSIALGRVEVVADGASAIYGSDAIAGVVNFILRKNFDGLEGRVRYGLTDGNYKEGQVALIGGKRWSGGWGMIAGEYSKNTALLGKDLPFYQDNNVYRGGRDLRVTTCNPGNVTLTGSTTTYPIPAAGVTPATASTLVAGTANRCFYNGLDAVIPEQQRYSVVGAASQDIFPGLRVFADGFYSYRKGVIPALAFATVAVPSINPFYVAPAGVTAPACASSVGAPGARCVNVAYSFTPQTGALVNPYHSSSWNLTGGVEAQLGGDWKGTIYYAHGQAEEIADRHLGVNAGALAIAARDTNPATALNVFGGPNNPATLAKITDNLFIITGRTRLDVLNGQADGSLFELPGGKVRLAIGAEHRVEYTFTDLVSGQAATPLDVRDAGTRDVDAQFAELFIPFFGAGNARPGLEQLSLSAAIRHERYSGFGDTTNPKFGLTYKPVRGVTLKGTYGTSFRAPTFTEISTIAGGAGLYFDQNQSGPNNTLLTGIGIAGGNPNLKPETAKTWSAGIELNPVRGLVASLNYFRINYTDQIIALRGTAGLLFNPIYASFVQFNPTQAQIAALINSGLPINSAINPALVTFIQDGRRQNLGTSLMRGVDYAVSYDWSRGDLHLDAGIQGTYVTKYLFEAVRGAGLVDVRNTIGFPQKFRFQADAGAEYRGVRGRVTLNHLGSYLNNTLTPTQRVKAYDTVDVSLGYDMGRHITLSADVRNLFDKNPPFVDIVRGYDPQSASPVPRLISVTASVKM